MASVNFKLRVVLCRIRLFPTLIFGSIRMKFSFFFFIFKSKTPIVGPKFQLFLAILKHVLDFNPLFLWINRVPEITLRDIYAGNPILGWTEG